MLNGTIKVPPVIFIPSFSEDEIEIAIYFYPTFVIKSGYKYQEIVRPNEFDFEGVDIIMPYEEEYFGGTSKGILGYYKVYSKKLGFSLLFQNPQSAKCLLRALREWKEANLEPVHSCTRIYNTESIIKDDIADNENQNFLSETEPFNSICT